MENQLHTKLPGMEVFHLQGTLNDIDFPGFLDKIENFFHINIPGFEEKGSDNTFRFCAANLNVKGTKISMGGAISNNNINSIENIPIYVFPKISHFGSKHGILASIDDKSHAVYKLILNILNNVSMPSSPIADYPPFSMLNVRVVDQLGNPHEDFIVRFYFGNADEQREIKVAHRYENKEIDCYYLEFRNLSRVSKFGFRIEPNRIGNTIYSPSNTIDIYYPAKGINFLEAGKTHFIEVVIEKSLDKKAFSFMNPKED